MAIPESTTNMQNPFAAEKRVKRLEDILPEFGNPPWRGLSSNLDDLADRTLPPMVFESTTKSAPNAHIIRTELPPSVVRPSRAADMCIIEFSGKSNIEHRDYCIRMTDAEYVAVMEFLNRFKAQENAYD